MHGNDLFMPKFEDVKPNFKYWRKKKTKGDGGGCKSFFAFSKTKYGYSGGKRFPFHNIEGSMRKSEGRITRWDPGINGSRLTWNTEKISTT